MGTFTVIYDACVLYPASLRDLLVRLARTGFFSARWTDAIHDEWTRNLLANRPELSTERVYRTRQKMNIAVKDSLVTGYEEFIPVLALPDPDDRHVLAAALRCSASVIVTYNLPDFPADILKKYRIEAQHPDEFLMHVFDLSPGMFCRIVREQREDLRNPPQSAGQLLDMFELQQLPRIATHLREMMDLI